MAKRRVFALALLLVILALVVLRLLLPDMALAAINQRLASMGDYGGKVDDVDLAIWRGAYSLHGLRIVKTAGTVDVPLLDAPQVDIALAWRDLLRGAIVADVDFRRPVVHFVDGGGPASSQSGAGVDWRDRLDAIVPIRIDTVTITDGEAHFHNVHADPPVDLVASEVTATIDNLTNVRDQAGERVAELVASATMFDSARLEAEARFDPFGRMDEFSLALRLLAIDLTRANDLARAYAGIDFESGTGQFVMELEAVDGHLQGYAKPLFRDIQIFSWRSDVQEQGKNPFRIAWEAAVAGVATVFRNQPADQFATRIEISGSVGDADTSLWSAVVGVLRNAFVEALNPYFEGTTLPQRDRSGR